MYTRGSALLSKEINRIITDKNATLGAFFKTPFSKIIEKLFANNEQGFFYDLNDLSMMYQDAAGTVPVTGSGQPVGLMLDKSKGAVIGVNTANPTTVIGSGTGGAAFKTTTVSTTHTVGKWYEVSMQVSNFSGTSDVGFTNASFSDTPILSRTISGNGIISFKGRATEASIRVYMRSANNADFSNISIKEITGNHAFQTTSASRPILRRNAVTGTYYLEFDGSDDFLQTNNIDFTVTDKVSLFAGVRKLSDATQAVLVELSSSWSVSAGTFAIFAPPYNGGAGYTSASRLSVADIANQQAVITTGYPSPVSSVVTSLFSTDTKLRVDGKLKITNTANKGTGNYGNYPLYIGRRAGTTIPFNGHIYSLIGIGRLSTGSEIAAIEKELAKQIQKIADNYMYDSKILAIIKSNDELENIAKNEIDGVIYKNLI